MNDIFQNKHKKNKTEVIYLFAIIDDIEFGVRLIEENYRSRLKDNFFSLHKNEKGTVFSDLNQAIELMELIRQNTDLIDFKTRTEFVKKDN